MDNPVVLLYDYAGSPVSSTAALTTSRPGQALYTAAGAAAQGGLLVLGSDYGTTPKAQVPRVDANGVAVVADAFGVTSGTTVASPRGPVTMGLSSGAATPLQIDALGNLVVMQDQLPTFSVVSSAVALASGKSLLALVNSSTTGRVLRLVGLYVVNSTVGAGVLTSYNIYATELRPITGVSATGTALSALAYDSADTFDSGVKMYSGATVTGDTQGPYRRWITSNYGLTVDAQNSEPFTADQQGRFPWVQSEAGPAKPITVRPGAGLHVKCVSTATTGYVDVTCVFTLATA